MKWTIKKVNNESYYQQKYKVNSLLSKHLAYKNWQDEELQNILQQRLLYHDFTLFDDALTAINRIRKAIDNKEKICIYGDYDCDGILGTSVLVEAFRQLGITVGYHIPHRTKDGYGLHAQRVREMATKGYQLIITVDNGIKAFEAIETANELGIDVIITDHHGFDETLPKAQAIIHPITSPTYPFGGISGGFVAYKIASALLGKHDKYLFCLAAITTISDMMPLVDENRPLVKRALGFMEEEDYPSLALLKGEKQPYSMRTLQMTIIPKINSFGRLCDMVSPVHLIRYFVRGAKTSYQQKIASYAVTINNKRQQLTRQQYQAVMDSLSGQDDFLYSYETQLNEGIIGLVAGKYTRDFYRPSFVMQYDEAHQMYRGSARGIKELPLTTIFDHVKDLLLSYGGHALAGGFSVSKENCEVLKKELDSFIHSSIAVMPEPTKEALAIALSDITQDNIASLDVLQPQGMGNEEIPLYLADIPIIRVQTVGQGKHLKFTLQVLDQTMDALFFNHGTSYEQYIAAKTVSLIGKLELQSFRGRQSICMMIEHIMEG